MTATVNITCAKDGTVLASNLVTDAYTCPKDVVDPVAIRAKDYAKADGTTDDTAALDRAAAAAIAEGKPLFFASGAYKVVDWSPPAGLTARGEGPTSHIKGRVRWRSRQSFTDLMTGDKTTAALSPIPGVPAQGTTFTRVRFRGGGGKPTLSAPTGSSATRNNQARDFHFLDCDWECNYQSTFSRLAKDVSWFVRREFGDIMENIVFENCHFGVKNEQGRTGGIMGGHEIWSSWAEEACKAIGDRQKGYFDSLYFTRCTWERMDVWNLDISGYQYCPPSYTENTVYITDCVFKGLSGAYHPEYTTRVTAQVEPSMDAVIARNVFGIGDSNGWKFIKGSQRCQFYDNVFDYRTYADTVDKQNGKAMIDSIYGINQVIRCGTDIGNIGIKNNKLLLPTGKYTSLSQQGWIYDPQNRCAKSGNSVEWSTNPGPLSRTT